MPTERIYSEFMGRTNEGESVHRHCLSSGNGMQLKVIDYGAALASLRWNGSEICLGFDNLAPYLDHKGYLGAICGRVANRISNAQFNLNGKQYNVDKNHGRHSLHGGHTSFSKRVWEPQIVVAESFWTGVCFSLHSPNGEAGYPGDLNARVYYILTHDNCLVFYYRAKQLKKPGPVNLTNHAYFNLEGEETGHLRNHDLSIQSDSYLEIDEELIPTGRLVQLNEPEQKIMDLRRAVSLGSNDPQSFPTPDLPLGYDHCYVLNKNTPVFVPDRWAEIPGVHGIPNNGKLYHEEPQQEDMDNTLRLYTVIKRLKPQLASSLSVHSKDHPKMEKSMEIYTSAPSIQFYTGRNLNEQRGRGGELHYKPYSALCLETQYLPDSPNQQDNPNFPSIMLEPGEVYEEITIHKFSSE